MDEGKDNLVDGKDMDDIRRKVAKKFPEMEGVKPSVKAQSGPNGSGDQYLLTFKGKADLPGGRKMNRIVRVVADERGRIIKMSTSK
ncbi:MAG: hypothetical protein ACERKX_15070 [Anaerolineales bacterium]